MVMKNCQLKQTVKKLTKDFNLAELYNTQQARQRYLFLPFSNDF